METTPPPGRRHWLALAIPLIALLALWALRRAPAPDAPAPAPQVASVPAAKPPPPPAAPPPAAPAPAQASGPAPREGGRTLGWGAGPGQVGRARPQEGNPEGPMSLTPDGRGGLVVLDQVNGRLLRLWPDGGQGALPVAQQAPQDVAVAADGTLAVLDRVRDQSVALLSPEGRVLGELPVAGRGIGEPGGVTGVFTDGDSVYLEREHGQSIRVGDTAGHADAARPEVPGRPSRDGRSWLLAGIIDRAAGRVYLALADRQSGANRFTRELRLGAPVPALLGLDSDRQGTIYLLAQLSRPGGAVAELVCLEPTAGEVLGEAELPLSTLPEESLRTFAALDEGGAVYALFTEQGVQYLRVGCR